MFGLTKFKIEGQENVILWMSSYLHKKWGNGREVHLQLNRIVDVWSDETLIWGPIKCVVMDINRFV